MNILVLVTSSMRSVKSPQSKMVAVDLLLWGGGLVNDDVRLNRLVPYVSCLISDDHESAVVRARAITCVTALLAKVRDFPVSEQQVFAHYVLPTLASALKDAPHNELVCVAYAANLGAIAETAQRFLDTGHALKRKQLQERNQVEETVAAATASKLQDDLETMRGGGGEMGGEGAAEDSGAPAAAAAAPAYELGYDSEVVALHEQLISVASEMLMHRSAAVKRMLLADILRLCVLVGRERTCHRLLPLIITVLNHRGDWQLRAAFFENLVGIASYVGRESLQHFILPCILQALTDVHELVVEGCIRSLSSLLLLGLLPRQVALPAVQVALPLLLHPAPFLRLAVIGLVTALADHIGAADSWCYLLPLLKPYLKSKIYTLSAETLQDALISPASRVSLEVAIDEARRALEGPDEADATTDPWVQQRHKLALLKAAASAAAAEADTSVIDIERLHEADLEKLAMLHQHIRAVALARMMQHKSDEQVLLERRHEQEVIESEEWLQEEWDTFFGGPPVPPTPSATSTTSSYTSTHAGVGTDANHSTSVGSAAGGFGGRGGKWDAVRPSSTGLDNAFDASPAGDTCDTHTHTHTRIHTHIQQGSDDQKVWVPLEFRFKPGNVSTAPSWVLAILIFEF